MRRFIVFTLLYLWVFVDASGQHATGNNLKIKMDWDPNDPNCPCYEVQKQADKEYKKLLMKEKDSEFGYGRVSAKKFDYRKRKKRKYSGKGNCPEW